MIVFLWMLVFLGLLALILALIDSVRKLTKEWN